MPPSSHPFLYLPKYAHFLLEFKLREFCTAMLQASREVNLPILRYFKDIPDDQLVTMGMDRNRELLDQLANQKIEEIIERSTSAWTTNQLPMIQRDQVVADDIVMVSFTRRKVFRDLLHLYAKDMDHFGKVMEEVDRFTLLQDTQLFHTFLDLQQEEINGINKALQKRESELLEAQEIGQIGSFEWDLAGKNSSYTPQVFKILEMEQASTLPSFMEDVHPDDREKLAAAIKQGLEAGNFECEYRYLKGKVEKVIWSRGKGQFENGKIVKIVGTLMDVTVRHQTIDQLLESEQLHKQAQALTHIGNWSWSIASNRVNWSDEMYRIYGLEPQSEIMSLERFINFVHPDDKEQRLAEIKHALETRVVAEYHFRIVTGKGEMKVLRGRGEVRTDKDNNPTTLTGTCQDITKEFLLLKELREREEYTANLNSSLEQKNIELRRTNAELESFNFVASHDLKEPLRKIRIFSDMLLEEADKLPTSTAGQLRKMHEAAGRMQKLIDDFLSFSQTASDTQAPERIDLSEILEEVKSDLAGLVEETHATIQSPKLPVIMAIPFQMRQLFTNLIGNALKYRKDGESPKILVATTIVSGASTKMEGAVPEKKYYQISITDNGIGFDQKYSTKVFELFQRLHTKEKYSGTGIGLAICKKIVENHQGFIAANGIENKGAVLIVFLPVPDSDLE